MTHAIEVDAAPDSMHLQKINCHLLPPVIFNPLVSELGGAIFTITKFWAFS